MGFMDALGDLANSIVGGGGNKNQRLAQAWQKDFAKKAQNPAAKAKFQEAAQLLFDGHANKAQRLFDEANAMEKSFVAMAAPGKTRRPAMDPAANDTPDSSAADPNEDPYDGPDYVSMLRSQLGSARAAVEAQFAAALGDITSREQASGQMAEMLPQQLTDRYNATGAGLQQSIGSMAAAQNASGLTQLMPTEATMAPLQQALAQEQAAAMASADFTKLGINQMFSNQRADLGQQRLSAMADIGSQEESLLASALENERDRQFRAAQALEESDAAGVTGYGKREVSLGRGGDLILSAANPSFQSQGKTQFAPDKAEAIRSGTDSRGKVYDRSTKLLNQVTKPKEFAAALQLLQTKKKYRKRPNAASLALADSGLANLYGGK